MTGPILPARPIRYRPRMGRPTCFIEVILQWAWKWRVEIMLGWILASVVASIALQVWR